MTAAVDHHGELLRLGLSDDGALDRVHQALADLGYEAFQADLEGHNNRRWYGSATARELSREEARVIADRVVPPRASSYRLAEPAAARLASTVSAALYECFTAHTLGSDAPTGSLRSVCSRAVEEAVISLIGANAARDLAAHIGADLREGAAGS